MVYGWFGAVRCPGIAPFGDGASVAARQAHREHRALARLARHGHVAAHHARELARESKCRSMSAALELRSQA
jgi:hypothetical protein